MAACFMVFLMSTPTKVPLIAVDMKQVDNAIRHKDVAGFVTQEAFSDQKIAEILNRNIEPEEEEEEEPEEAEAEEAAEEPKHTIGGGTHMTRNNTRCTYIQDI
jgi:type II secretory pathway component HofQ